MPQTYDTTYVRSFVHFYATARREGAVSVAFVRPSVAYIANNSRIQRPSVPKFGRKVPHRRCYLHTSFKAKRSKVRVTRPINADKHRAPYLPNAKVYELLTWQYGCRTTSRISRRRRDLQGQRSRSQGHVISMCRVGPMAHKSKTNSRSITKICRRVPHRTCYIASRSKGHRSGSQAD